MIEIREKFKQFCVDLFGEEDGILVASFYNKFFSPTVYKKEGAERSLTYENKVSNINYLIESAGKDNFLACVYKFKRDWDKGLVKTHSFRYFTAVAEKYKATSKDTELKKEEELGIPKKYKKVRDDGSSDFYNWDYKCSCGEIIQPWLITCPKCESIIGWSKI